MGGTGTDALRAFSQVVDSCLSQHHATGVYTSGTVFNADFYQSACQKALPKGDIPLTVWVFVGLGQTPQGNQLYTVGMEKFGKEELEVLNNPNDMRTLHASLLSMCHYLISSDVTLQDGETIGFSADQKWAIRRSESVYAPSEFSLKISM